MPDGMATVTGLQTRFEVDLSVSEAHMLARLAEDRRVTPTDWLNKCVHANITRMPVWFQDDVCGFDAVASALRQIAELNTDPNEPASAIRSTVLMGVVDKVIARLDKSDDLCMNYWCAPHTI